MPGLARSKRPRHQTITLSLTQSEAVSNHLTNYLGRDAKVSDSPVSDPDRFRPCSRDSSVGFMHMLRVRRYIYHWFLATMVGSEFAFPEYLANLRNLRKLPLATTLT